MTSSVDPSLEIEAIMARLDALGPEAMYMGIPGDFELPIDGFSNIVAYRDMQPGSVIPAAGQRLMGADEQSQPYVWAFQISHAAPTRHEAVALSTQTDISLIGWAPSMNASKIGAFYFTVYDEFSKNGEKVEWIATRFYQTVLGQQPEFGNTPETILPIALGDEAPTSFTPGNVYVERA